jgi:hypothetical protein
LAAVTGWWVFPCGVDRRPACDWPRWASADPAYVEKYWPRCGAAVGVACGLSGLVVVDWDRVPEDWPSFRTYERLSVTKAMPHQYFSQRATGTPSAAPSSPSAR